MQDNRLTLRQLNLMVKDAIEMQLPDEYWVEAELAECRERGGHCYLELIEKEDNTNTPVAKASAKCWRQTWLMLQPYFERTTGQPLRTGMKVLLKVYAQFHEAYGFSWIVTDIDPTYTLGDMARKRRAFSTFSVNYVSLALPSVLLSFQQKEQQAMVTSADNWRIMNMASSSKLPCFLPSCRANRLNHLSLQP